MMDFRTGNSGNHLRSAVVKLGHGCRQEGAYCQLLGSRIAPTIYAIIPEGYVMEALDKMVPHPDLLREIEQKLEAEVWSRAPLPVSNDRSWQDTLMDFGISRIPKFKLTEECLVHGDPTVSNALVRGGSLILCDPRPPRDYIPQTRETDMGRILQSMLGWETAAYGVPKITYHAPRFLFDPQHRDAAVFWCGAAAARIEYLEEHRESGNRQNILDWCRTVRGLCNV